LEEQENDLNFSQIASSFNLFSEKLFAYFKKDYYENENDLKKDFQRFFQDESFFVLLYSILEEVEDETNISFDREYFLNINENRIKLCKNCQKPFFSFDPFNKMLFCYETVYFKYNFKKNRYFKSSSKKTNCAVEFKKTPSPKK
jgi:hypothetical protein